MIIAGVDEAGRGAVLGPMVIAGVSIPAEDEQKLKAIGVRDSKELSPRARTILAKRIEKIVKDILVVKVGPCKIDDYNKQGVNLNQLEAMKIASILDCLGAGKSFVDSPDNDQARFGRTVAKLMGQRTEIISEHRADQKYPVVSAASIIAKVERDREIEELRKVYGIEGSGYPSDERTISWMKAYLAKHGKFPEKGLVRFSWQTTKDMLGEKKQKGLFGFMKK